LILPNLPPPAGLRRIRPPDIPLLYLVPKGVELHILD